jgi:hypothetical protein
LLLSPASACAADNTCDEADPVSPAMANYSFSIDFCSSAIFLNPNRTKPKFAANFGLRVRVHPQRRTHSFGWPNCSSFEGFVSSPNAARKPALFENDGIDLDHPRCR